jgi:hypothetical protein
MATTKPKVTNRRRAGRSHEVVTVMGGDTRYCTQPCAQCPWRIDQMGSFPAEAFRHSANTVYDMSGHSFACHMAGAEKPTTCAGFLLRGAEHNMNVRLALARGDIDPDKVSDGGHALYDGYREMAEANGVDKRDPVLRPCR